MRVLHWESPHLPSSHLGSRLKNLSVATNAEVAQNYPTCVDRHIWCDTRSMLADGLIEKALDIHHKDHVLLKIRSTLETTLDDTSNFPSGRPKP